MAKYYEIQQTDAIGHYTTLALVINPVVKNGGIYAKKVGELYYNVETGKSRYHHCNPVDFIIIGNVACVERTDNPFR